MPHASNPHLLPPQVKVESVIQNQASHLAQDQLDHAKTRFANGKNINSMIPVHGVPVPTDRCKVSATNSGQHNNGPVLPENLIKRTTLHPKTGNRSNAPGNQNNILKREKQNVFMQRNISLL